MVEIRSRSMGVGSSLYMYNVVVKKVHVPYLISWWVLVCNGDLANTRANQV